VEQSTTRTEQVIRQTQRRVAGEQVPAGDKLLSVFEPHTAIIRRDKPRAQTEFGHKVVLGEVEGRIIAQYATLVGNAADSSALEPSVARARISHTWCTPPAGTWWIRSGSMERRS